MDGEAGGRRIRNKKRIDGLCMLVHLYNMPFLAFVGQPYFLKGQKVMRGDEEEPEERRQHRN